MSLFKIYLNTLPIVAELVTTLDSHLRGPAFVMEPPPRLEFSNSSGGWLDCSASGNPQPSIDWLSLDGTSVGDVIGIRQVLRNGTLVLHPFAAASYRHNIHNTVYRCVASNNVGRVISREVRVHAGKSFPNDIPIYNIVIISCSFIFCNLMC